MLNGVHRWLSTMLLGEGLTIVCGPVQASQSAVHVVRQGETAGAIAERFGCALRDLKKANPRDLGEPDKLRAGARLVIPPSCNRRGSSGPRVRGSRDCGWTHKHIESTHLKALMADKGFRAPAGFRALVVKTALKSGETEIAQHQAWDWGGRSTDPKGWNPASTVKLFSAVTALERLYENGMGVDTQVTFHYKRGDKTLSIKELMEESMHLSKNIPHNRLTQLAGFDRVNGSRGTLQRVGLRDTYVQRAYAWPDWRAQGQPRSFRATPPITLKDGGRTLRLKAQVGKAKTPCQSSACTSVSDLARMMCVMMFHEQLPEGKRLRLGGRTQGPHLAMLRREMDRKRRGRVDKVWDQIEKVFPPPRTKESPGYRLYRKAGFSRGWLSENMFIYPGPMGSGEDRRERWIITMAAKGGRGALTSAARLIAEIIDEGKL